MGRFSRAEIEEAFQNYQAVALQAGTSGKWSYEEDIYNPVHFQKMIGDWIQVKEKHASKE